MRIIVIRHGESEGDILNVHEGRADFNLTEKGHIQAEAMAEYVSKTYKIDKIYVSTLKRAVQTAKHLSEKIADCSFYEIYRQLEYKCKWNNIELIVADRWFASSKICNHCGYKKPKLSLSERVYKCECCGYVEDRDYNASLNLRDLAYN